MLALLNKGLRTIAHRTDATELQIIEDLHAYHLIPGTVAQVLKEDPATGMSEMRLGVLTTSLWTYTRFPSK
jgi:hypothetical protein